ncbi:MAG: acetyl-CoA carboxylase biotin carboxylase subunit [candidate division KSB1 bacterium]|jgi:acetyl-CoA carboxylase biotin carboxylase subunit|nr:acetyl-CoA carboxylase biotin carboxylase subunit [candidate division KSB1 bacterium]
MTQLPFKKILIANRGEIAVRVIRACREMGIASVAIYTEIDRTALHVRMADEAYALDPEPSADSYLAMGKILNIAARSGAEAVHPGYGFLAENGDFAAQVNERGLVFIGPSPDTISLLGDKMAARTCMIKAGVPVVPGLEQRVTDIDAALKNAGKIGYPVLIKAAAGGGGKGMRLVHRADEMEKSIQMAMSEARSAFGDDRIYIEKYIARPRHIEIQVIADAQGNTVHLGERECSIQRRHQKVIEESPSPVVDDDLRKKMGETAVAAAKAANYVNAGTVEFLVDEEMNYYFLEVNTRLQVEHPVTEMVTGYDLVKEQINVASGLPLSFSQEDIAWNGHAIECRIYAEDPENNFMPSIGTIGSYVEPQGPGIRVDSGQDLGGEVSIFYDPLISKLVAWGRDRNEAVSRMRRALNEYRISGLKTVIPFHKAVMDNADFNRGAISTHFIADSMAAEDIAGDVDPLALKAMSIMTCLMDYKNKGAASSSETRATEIERGMWKYCGRRKSIGR